MPLDHPLGCEEGLNLFAQDGNTFRLLDERMRMMKPGPSGSETDPHPFRTFGTKAKALKAKTNAGLATPLRVRLLVTLLQRDVSG